MNKKQKRNILCILAFCMIAYAIQGVYATYQKEESIAILGYHHIVPDKDKETYFANNMWVSSLSSFRSQMKLLHDEGYVSVSLKDLYDWKQGKKKLPKKSVVITFDDGFYSTIKFAQPVLKTYGFKGSVFVIGSLIDNHRKDYHPKLRQHASLKDMEDERILSYYAHSYDLHHKKQGKFKVNTVSKEQLIKDTENIASLTSIEYYAYPYGKSNSTIQEVLRQKGVKLAFGYHENKKAKQNDNPYHIPRFSINAYTTLDVFQAMLESR